MKRSGLQNLEREPRDLKAFHKGADDPVEVTGIQWISDAQDRSIWPLLEGACVRNGLLLAKMIMMSQFEKENMLTLR